MPAPLPAYVQLCRYCGGDGHGPRREPCPMCTPPGRYRSRGAGYVYRATLRPVPDSVIAQIETANSQNTREA